jgi:hypothetical protein
MRDIVERLRKVGHIDFALMDEAATHIEALDSDLAKARETNRKLNRRLQLAEAIRQSADDYLTGWIKAISRPARRRERMLIQVILRDIQRRVVKMNDRISREEE